MLNLSSVFRDSFLLVENFLSEQESLELCQELDAIKVAPAPEVYGKVKQKFSIGYRHAPELLNLPRTQNLLNRYLEIYQKFEGVLGFDSKTQPLLAFNVYPIGGYIEAHYDQSKYRNLIASFTLRGSSPFAIHSDRETKQLELQLNPGSLLLLAAPRNSQEKQIRPLHSVGPSNSERLSLVIRHEVIP